MDREYFLEIVQDAIVYVYLKTEKGEVKEFVVKLLWNSIGNIMKCLDMTVDTNALIKIYLIQRGGNRKVWYDFLDNSQALTMAITDIKDN